MSAKFCLTAVVAMLAPGTGLGQSEATVSVGRSANPGPVYPSTSGPWIATEMAKLTASDPMQNASFGSSVAISGDTLVVGANGVKPNYGAAYVFVRTGTTWTEQAKLKASISLPIFAGFGSSAAISGDSVVIGVPNDGSISSRTGSAYVFVRNGSAWTEQEKLTASDGADLDEFGRAVAISGDTILIGAKGHDPAGGTSDNAGSVYVFVRSGANWSEVQQLTASDAAAGDQFGASVALSGDACLVGASYDDHGNSWDVGSAYVFVRTGTTWTEQQKLTGGGGTVSDNFGSAVAIDGDTCLVGAPEKNVANGSAYVFMRNGGAWIEQQELFGSFVHDGDLFGGSVSISGEVAVVGAAGEGNIAGTAYLFVRSGTIWIEQARLTASDGAQSDSFGYATCILDDTAIITAVSDDHSIQLINAGSAYVFQLSQASRVSYCTAGTSASGCVATMGASGIPSSIASSGFFLSASGVEGARVGRFIYGTSGQQSIPWGNGSSYQCVVPPLVRAPIMPGTGTVGSCDGAFAFDLNAFWCPSCPKATKNPGAGAIVQAQLWYRDPLSTSNQTTSLSDAIEFVVGP